MGASVYYFCTAACFVVAALGESNETAHDLKRVAGYYTESGVYRGGLWRAASNTESEVYHCLRNTSSQCLHWSLQEENRMKREYGNCTCAPTELPFCDHWDCTTKSFDEYAECVVGRESIECVGISFTESLTCACTSRAPSQRYCSEWSCREDSPIDDSENEDYQCLEEDVTGEYCYRWKGNISSSFAIESSVCECFTRGELFCKHW